MQGLKVEELKEGHIYKCLLSDRKVLVINKTKKTNNDVKDAPLEWWEVSTHAYDPNTNMYDNIIVFDYQLASCA